MNKFELKPFDKVLVRCSDQEKWVARLFDRQEGKLYVCQDNHEYTQCVPYTAETKHLHNTTDPVVEPYVPARGDIVKIKWGIVDGVLICKSCTTFGNNTVTLQYAVICYTNGSGVRPHILADNWYSCPLSCVKKASKDNVEWLFKQLQDNDIWFDSGSMTLTQYPWLPKEGGEFYFVGDNLTIVKKTWHEHMYQSLLKTGNIFQTEKEAGEYALLLTKPMYGRLIHNENIQVK